MKKTALDLEKLSSELRKFVEEREWDQFHSVKNLSMALSVEVSELMEILQWMSEEDSNKMASNKKLMTKVEEEVADIFIYLMRIVNKLDIDLELVTYAKMKKNSEKYPVELARGNSKKYSDF